ncbi:hypothetical protein [Microbacterium sp. T32]|nr:hypothetical protein [Microbacterium sp. T32]
MRIRAAAAIVGGIVLLGGCSGGAVQPDADPGADDAAVRATTLSILCATRTYQQEFAHFAEQEITLETLTQLREMSDDGADLFHRSAAAFRDPGTPWPDDIRPDIEAVASYYDHGATLFEHLGAANDTESLAVVFQDFQQLPDVSDALGRVAAGAGISADLAGECDSR